MSNFTNRIMAGVTLIWNYGNELFISILLIVFAKCKHSHGLQTSTDTPLLGISAWLCAGQLLCVLLVPFPMHAY